jgi:hypothetical protein
LVFVTSLEYYVLVVCPVRPGGRLPAPPDVGIASVLFTLGMCVAAAVQADLPRR